MRHVLVFAYLLLAEIHKKKDTFYIDYQKTDVDHLTY